MEFFSILSKEVWKHRFLYPTPIEIKLNLIFLVFNVCH